jgi:uncharacterized damage-inducible protein DinB
MSPQLEGLIDWWNTEHAKTVRAIGAMPAGQTGYRPHEKSMTAGDLAWHIARAEAGLVNYILTGAFEGSGGEKPAAPETFQGIVEWKEQTHRKGVERVSALDEAKLTEVVDFFGRKMPRMGIISFLLMHEIHHRGQLSVYIRLAGGKVPAIYGSSADEPRQ